MKIENFILEDYDKLISLWQRAGLPHKPEGRDSFANIRKQIELKSNHYLVIRNNEELIASIMVSHNKRKGWINRLAVAPQYRGKNLAAKLIEQAETILSCAGVEIVATLIETWNKGSLQLFKKLDYVRHDDIIYFTKRKNSKV